MGQSDIEAALGVDMQRQALGCTDVSCAEEIGGALGVDLVLYGEVSTLGSKYNVNLSAAHTLNAVVVARGSAHVDKTRDTLADRAPVCVYRRQSRCGRHESSCRVHYSRTLVIWPKAPRTTHAVQCDSARTSRSAIQDGRRGRVEAPRLAGRHSRSSDRC